MFPVFIPIRRRKLDLDPKDGFKLLLTLFIILLIGWGCWVSQTSNPLYWIVKMGESLLRVIIIPIVLIPLFIFVGYIIDKLIK